MKAKVILRGARTYTLGGKRWIKDVPGIVNGDDVKQYKENAYFYVVMLKDSGPKKKKEKEKQSKAEEPQVDKKKTKLKK